MMIDEFLDIPYCTSAPDKGPHSLQSFDLFVPRQSTTPTTTEDFGGTSSTRSGVLVPVGVPAPAPAPLVCFVHGGAWRSEDKSDHGALARRLAAYTSSPVVVPNYRLTKPNNQLQHPAHAQDVLQLLTFLLSWSGPPGTQTQGGSQSPPYDPNRIFLIGHSCSAHMLACILLDSSEPTLVPSLALLRAVRGVIFSEGIYDIDALLHSFPKYRDWFIRDTFGDFPAYDRYSTTKMIPREGTSQICWAILHSKGDMLVDTLQSQAMYDHLQSLHEGSQWGVSQVVKKFDDLNGGHNAILQSGRYIQIVGDFILNISKRL